MGELDYIGKGDKTVNGQYRFVSHDQVTAKIHPLLVRHGVTIVPSVEEVIQEGNRTMVKLLVSFVNADCPSDTFSIRSIGYGVDPSDKGPGKAISYALKYALLKVFCLETGDDPDNDANSAYEPAKCLEFDAALATELDEKTWPVMKKFLEYSAKIMNKHPEDVKREAMKRLPDFMNGFHKWSLKKK